MLTNKFMRVLSRKFFERDPAVVAKQLLGKILTRKLNEEVAGGVIVETEAYYGKEDPASRAYLGSPKYCVKLLGDSPGKALVYNVHNNWLFNVVAHEKGCAGAVLVRAIEPVKGLNLMLKNRKVNKLKDLTSGPGKLTKALRIDKSLNGRFITSEKSEVYIEDNSMKFEVSVSYRIGVKRDLTRKLRFFIKGNKFVSR